LKQGRDDTEESAETEPPEDVDDDGYFCKLASCKDYKKHWTVQNHCQEEGCGRPGTNILTHPDHPDATVKKETFCEEKKCEKYVSLTSIPKQLSREIKQTIQMDTALMPLAASGDQLKNSKSTLKSVPAASKRRSKPYDSFFFNSKCFIIILNLANYGGAN
jgi:hypothetical protein